MKATRSVAIAVLVLLSLGCATVPGPEALPSVSVAGEWSGDAPVGATIGCCLGASGPVRLLLEQSGGVVRGSVDGIGFHGSISAQLAASQLWGSCDCQIPNARLNLRVEGSVSGDEMIFRLGDVRMTLTRASAGAS